MIHVRNLIKTYPDFEHGAFVALDGISFDALPGEIFGLLGPNGAGKTTALRILSTVFQPTSGVVEIANFDVVTQPQLVRHQIGFVSANTAVYDRMTAYEMVAYFGQLYGMMEPELSERIDEVFTVLSMHDFRDVLGAKMSTGMRQKVSIARAIVHDPPVLIFDEATSGLDVLVAKTLLENVLQLKSQGKCIIFSTHIMREVEKICDKIAIMHRGKILAQGSLEELKVTHQEADLEDLFFRLIEEHDRTIDKATVHH